jgi:hypothetical protein
MVSQVLTLTATAADFHYRLYSRNFFFAEYVVLLFSTCWKVAMIEWSTTLSLKTLFLDIPCLQRSHHFRPSAVDLTLLLPNPEQNPEGAS